MTFEGSSHFFFLPIVFVGKILNIGKPGTLYLRAILLSFENWSGWSKSIPKTSGLDKRKTVKSLLANTHRNLFVGFKSSQKAKTPQAEKLGVLEMRD